MRAPSTSFMMKENLDWEQYTTEDFFAGKRVVFFSLPGAYTPICSSKQLPSYEENYQNFINLGIDEVYVISVNDCCVMSNWLNSLDVKNVKYIPDGSGEFTRDMDMLVWKPNQNFGYRSWRYAAVVDNMRIEKLFIEEGKNNRGTDDDPYEVSKPENVLMYLKK